MSEQTVAARYAKSLLGLAEERNSVEAIQNDMDLFFRTVKANPELKSVLANPIVSQFKKINILEEIFSDKVDVLSITFFKQMVNKSRGEVLYTTAQEYVNLYDEKMHILHVTVVSASQLADENRKKIIADLQQATGCTIKLEAKVDPSLIGGFILTVGDRQIDTSIASDLKKLKKEFAQTAISN